MARFAAVAQVQSLSQDLLHVMALAKKKKKKPFIASFFFLLFFSFWLPRGLWSSQARDQIQATVVTYAAAVPTLDP